MPGSIVYDRAKIVVRRHVPLGMNTASPTGNEHGVVTRPRHNREVEEAGDMVGMFIARGWLHEGSPVVRLTTTPDVVAVEPVSMMVGTREALHQEIDRWLHEMEQRGE